MGSLSKLADDIASDNRIINNDIGFTETQIIPSESTWKITKAFNFSFNFNRNENIFLSLASGSRNNIALLDKFDANGICLFSFRKYFCQYSIYLNVSL